MPRKLNTINSGLSNLVFLRARTLNATPSGSTDTAVLRFNTHLASFTTKTGQVVNSKPLINVTTLAGSGSVYTIRRAGIYQATLSLSVGAGQTVHAGIGMDMDAAAPIVADPVVGTNGVLVASTTVAPSATGIPITLSTMLLVAPSDAAATVTVRALATNGAAGAPAGLVAAAATFDLVRVADCYT